MHEEKKSYPFPLLTPAMGLGLPSVRRRSGNATPAHRAAAWPPRAPSTVSSTASEVSTMNYLTTNTILEQTVGANVIDCLVEYDQAWALQPSLPRAGPPMTTPPV